MRRLLRLFCAVIALSLSANAAFAAFPAFLRPGLIVDVSGTLQSDDFGTVSSQSFTATITVLSIAGNTARGTVTSNPSGVFSNSMSWTCQADTYCPALSNSLIGTSGQFWVDLANPTGSIFGPGEQPYSLSGSCTVGESCLDYSSGQGCSLTDVNFTATSIAAVYTSTSGMVNSFSYCKGVDNSATGLGETNLASYTFTAANDPGYTLSISNSGNGTITSAPSGINCGSTCNAVFNDGSTVSLTATPANGYSFAGWSGACSGTGACSVTMNTAQIVSAAFMQDPPPPFALTVSSSGNGTVTSGDGMINCGSTCSANYTQGTQVNLTATPASGFGFAGWGGACSGIGACSVTMNAAQSVSASFTPLPTYTLAVSNAGGGTVSTATGTINCGATCSASFIQGTQVTLAATPATGFSFAGWSGAGCGGTGVCIVTMSGNQSVTATFSPTLPNTFSLQVTNAGGGTVASSDGMINCGSQCGATYARGTQISLTAAPASGFTFAGWSGACGGTGVCAVTMSANQVVMATFAPVVPTNFSLTVSNSGGGTVTSSPSGVSCGTVCSPNFPSGTVVSLTPTANSGFSFAGWGGDCSGGGTCILTMDQTHSVSASFAAGSPPTSPLLAAMLPASRSATVGGTVTAFATMINTGTAMAPGCAITPTGGAPLNFTYQTTDPTTNALSGAVNAPVAIAGNNGTQTFVIAVTPTTAFAPMQLLFSFACTNVASAPSIVGLNTLLVSASTTPVPDIVALAATMSNDGILHISGTSGSNAFAVATVDVGAPGAITVSANTGGATLPLAISLCQTNPSNGQCLSPPSSTVTATINSGDTPTFGIFGTAGGAIPFDPANGRIFVQFSDSAGAVRGETSVAVETQ
jgi:hypothetical protein